jgi:hypothetical protein
MGKQRVKNITIKPPTVDEFVSRMRQAYEYCEKLDFNFGKWDSRLYSVILHPDHKIIAVAHINRENLGSFSFDLIYDNKIQTQIDHEYIYDTIEQIVNNITYSKNTVIPTNLKTKNYIINRLFNSGYYINFLKENSKNITFDENDSRKWIFSVDPHGSSLYIIRYKDGNIRYYDGGQMVPMFLPKLYTESMEVIMTDLYSFGCIGKNPVTSLNTEEEIHEEQ